MEPSRDSQIDKLLEDVASIKSVLAENRPILKQLLLPVHFRVISLVGGISIIALSLFYYFLLDNYGSYYEIPNSLRIVAIVLVIAAYVLVFLLKRFLWVKSLKKLGSDYTFGMIVKKIYSYQLLHLWVPMQLIMVFLVVYSCLNGLERYIVSIAAIGMGIIYNSLGGMTRIWQYIATGYWLMLTGLLPFFLPTVSALLFLAVSLGIGLVLFSLISGGSPVIEEGG